MNKICVYPIKNKIKKQIRIPGSIGYTIRALNLAAMTIGTVKIKNPLISEDTLSMINALRNLGVKIDKKGDSLIVSGDIYQIKSKKYIIDIGISGRTARSLIALLSIIPGEKTIICSDAFKTRPIGDLVLGLRQLGAKIEYIEKDGFLPIKILSSKLIPNTIHMNGTVSSQFFSAIMMIAPLIGEIEIIVKGSQSSKPFIDMTISIMKDFGVKINNYKYKKYKIAKNQNYINPKIYSIEPEATSASYFFAIAALTNSEIKILNLNPESKQGDIKMADYLAKMGCIVNKNSKSKWIQVKGQTYLKGNTFDLNGTPDLVPTIAIVASFVQGKTILKNIAHVRLKETDRILAVQKELKKMNIYSDATKDSLIIHGGMPQGAQIDTYGDHRIAMSFAVAGTKITNVKIHNPDVVNKSFPSFWTKLNEIGIKTRSIN